MITLLFCVLMFAVFGKLAGFIYIALFLLVIGGVVSFVAARV